MENRRDVIKKIAAGLTTAMVLPALGSWEESKPASSNPIRHSVSKWCYGFLSLAELCQVVKKIGFTAVDLAGPKEWSILKEHGVDSSMCNGAEIGLTEGWNDPKHHAVLVKNYLEHISLVSKAGYKNLICFTGNKNGMDDETGLKNCVTGLKKIMSEAEKKGVIIQLELFNSKVNHPDYMADNSAFGIELCKRLDSPNFKLLYDIYHMQISEGDIISTIRQHHQFFGHYHTAGVPGRNEIDDTQELYYPAIMRAISETGFTGYVAQEFIPTGKTNEDKIKALADAIRICTI